MCVSVQPHLKAAANIEIDGTEVSASTLHNTFDFDAECISQLDFTKPGAASDSALFWLLERSMESNDADTGIDPTRQTSRCAPDPPFRPKVPRTKQAKMKISDECPNSKVETASGLDKVAAVLNMKVLFLDEARPRPHVSARACVHGCL